MKLGMNHPMGPLTLADFIGLDVCLAILNVLHDGLGDPKYRPCPLLRRMVAAGHLGPQERPGLLQVLMNDRAFVADCYERLLGRPADEAGLAHYAAPPRRRDADARRAGRDPARLRRIFRAAEAALPGVQPHSARRPVVRAREPRQVGQPRVAGDPEVARLGADRQGADAPQGLRADADDLRAAAARRARPTPTPILSVGAGHEAILYWLANHAGQVVATDLYEGDWQSAFCEGRGSRTSSAIPRATRRFPIARIG